jgi:hypothetical protein
VILMISIFFIIFNIKIKVGIIGLEHSQNCGNIQYLLK